MLTKLFIFLFVFAILFLVKQLYFLIQAIQNEKTFETTKSTLIWTGVSISYIIMTLFTGF